MLDTSSPNKPAGTDAPIQLTVAETTALVEIRSFLPRQHSSGRSVMLRGRALPNEVGATLPAPFHVLCLGPAEWLWSSKEQSAADLTKVAADATEQDLVLVNVSDGYAVLSVHGPAVRDLLSKGCGLDFHPRAFLIGHCARTRLAQIPVILECIEDWSSFDLYVPRSYSRCLTEWLQDAAIEINCQI